MLTSHRHVPRVGGRPSSDLLFRGGTTGNVQPELTARAGRSDRQAGRGSGIAGHRLGRRGSSQSSATHPATRLGRPADRSRSAGGRSLAMTPRQVSRRAVNVAGTAGSPAVLACLLVVLPVRCGVPGPVRMDRAARRAIVEVPPDTVVWIPDQRYGTPVGAGRRGPVLVLAHRRVRRGGVHGYALFPR